MSQRFATTLSYPVLLTHCSDDLSLPLTHPPLPWSPIQRLATMLLSGGRTTSTSYDRVLTNRDGCAYTLHYIFRIVNGSLVPAVNPGDPPAAETWPRPGGRQDVEPWSAPPQSGVLNVCSGS